MKRHLSILVVGLSLFGGRSFAREPQAPPPPTERSSPAGSIGKDPQSGSIFVGHYGETIELPHNWTAEAELRDETEAVYFHRKSHDDFGFRPFQPKKADYKPESFTPMGLVELVVIPKDAPGGLRSLKAIRAAKESELKQTGAEYKIFNGGGDWPLTAFHVETIRPYKLWQTYAESPNEFYILTMGISLKRGDDGFDQERALSHQSAMQVLARSLSDYLRLAHERTLGGKLFRFRRGSADGFISDFKTLFGDPPWVPKILGAVGALLAILTLWPGTTQLTRRFRFFGRSLLAFALLTGLAGFLAVFLPARFCDASWNSDEIPALIPVLLIPGASWAAARAFGSARPLRVLALTGIVAAAWTVAILWGADLKNLDEAVIVALNNTFILCFVGLTFGIAYCFGFGPLTNDEKTR
ncbi:MAG: hypothetical protein HYV14_14635 [Elusimicrobia bacterium]|nr:hypothetical protein [Elusimicrobiota bacterium]